MHKDFENQRGERFWEDRYIYIEYRGEGLYNIDPKRSSKIHTNHRYDSVINILLKYADDLVKYNLVKKNLMFKKLNKWIKALLYTELIDHKKSLDRTYKFLSTDEREAI